jgi:hypothetical protein
LLFHEAHRRAAIAGVPRERLQARVLLRRPAQDLTPTDDIMEVGGMNLDIQQVAQDIHDDMTLAALHCLPPSIPRSSLSCWVLTLCESMIP